MVPKKLIVLLFVLTVPLALFSQIQRIVHQAFDISDSVSTLELDIYGDYVVEQWPGDNILLESQIKLYNATEVILDHFVEAGRYKLEARPSGNRMTLVSLDKVHQKISTSRGECYEELEQRLFIPEEFSSQSPGLWSRPPKKWEKAADSVPASTGDNGSGSQK